MGHYDVSAEILGVTEFEYQVLELTATLRGECPCISCLAGEGDRLCVSCHYRYATIGENCLKCYINNDDAFLQVEEIRAELDEAEEEVRILTTPMEWADAKGRVIEAW